MAKVKDIYEFLDSIAPFETQLDFDNAGFLIGSGEREVTKVLICLDVTDAEIEYALEQGCQLIISHHPVIWGGLKSIKEGETVYRVIAEGLSVISAHTNLDLARGGVNDCLAQTLGLRDCAPMESVPMAVMGCLPEQMTAEQFAIHVRDSLHCGAVSYTEGSGMIERVAVVGGAGEEFAADAFAAGADAFVTGESKHHLLLAAEGMGKTLVTAGHYETEYIVAAPLAARLSEYFDDVVFIVAKEHPPVKYV
ncbi:MAG: Nif3-like dinuclear metal center hexameric protein [Clostridia bacterium]|nr:Nif3-like dinuclear metal center hexameric protein [Clostridia bacterium]